MRSIMPTQGFNIQSVVHDGFKLNVWDVGGELCSRFLFPPPAWLFSSTLQGRLPVPAPWHLGQCRPPAPLPWVKGWPGPVQGRQRVRLARTWGDGGGRAPRFVAGTVASRRPPSARPGAAAAVSPEANFRALTAWNNCVEFGELALARAKARATTGTAQIYSAACVLPRADLPPQAKSPFAHTGATTTTTPTFSSTSWTAPTRRGWRR